jgi:DnaJ-class molecular chaperone
VLFVLLVCQVLAGRNFYDILGVDSRASKKEIKKAYKNVFFN